MADIQLVRHSRMDIPEQDREPARRVKPTPARVAELLVYEPCSGLFAWRVDRTTKGRVLARANSLAGTLHPRGYWFISIDGKQHYAHQLAWVMVRGEWPLGPIDHIDGNRSNNRWPNLRQVTQQINAQNRRKAAVTNRSSGVLGVSRGASPVNPWRAQIRIDGCIKHLGSFPTIELASAAYIDAKRLNHKGCTL